MKQDDCVFCKIISGEIPSKTIYEDEEFKVIFDIAPATRGHAIIIPKKHVTNIFEIPDDMASHIYLLAKKIAIAFRQVFDMDGFNVLQNNGELAGQTVFHLHMHLLPRYKTDQVTIRWPQGSMPENADEIIEQIKKIMNTKV